MQSSPTEELTRHGRVDSPSPLPLERPYVHPCVTPSIVTDTANTSDPSHERNAARQHRSDRQHPLGYRTSLERGRHSYERHGRRLDQQHRCGHWQRDSSHDVAHRADNDLGRRSEHPRVCDNVEPRDLHLRLVDRGQARCVGQHDCDVECARQDRRIDRVGIPRSDWNVVRVERRWTFARTAQKETIDTWLGLMRCNRPAHPAHDARSKELRVFDGVHQSHCLRRDRPAEVSVHTLRGPPSALVVSTVVCRLSFFCFFSVDPPSQFSPVATDSPPPHATVPQLGSRNTR
jgi:hypothetical protein